MSFIDTFVKGRRKNYGMRQDGTPKGSGYFGELSRPDGNISTELSIGVDNQDIPLLNPLLTHPEQQYLLQGNDPTPEIINKAIQHARERRRLGKPAFYQEGEARPYGY